MKRRKRENVEKFTKKTDNYERKARKYRQRNDRTLWLLRDSNMNSLGESRFK